MPLFESSAALLKGDLRIDGDPRCVDSSTRGGAVRGRVRVEAPGGRPALPRARGVRRPEAAPAAAAAAAAAAPGIFAFGNGILSTSISDEPSPPMLLTRLLVKPRPTLRPTPKSSWGSIHPRPGEADPAALLLCALHAWLTCSTISSRMPVRAKTRLCVHSSEEASVCTRQTRAWW